MAELVPNTSSAELANNSFMSPTATGFRRNALVYPSTTYIYLAIRRPNKPPTTGTEVYNAIARMGTGAAATVTGVGFAPDLTLQMARTPSGYGHNFIDKLRGSGKLLVPTSTAAEATEATTLTSFNMDGVSFGIDANSLGVNALGVTEILQFFRRAPKFFDVVCYTGTGVARTVPHSLGVAPELMIVKQRNGPNNWLVHHSSLGPDYQMRLNMNIVPDGPASAYWNNTLPTGSVFTVGTTTNANGSGNTHVAYLFATKAGISKVGSYTGNGTTQTIDCGFTTGARFILIKRTDAAGDWYVWDTVRGLVAGNDPHLSLNSTAAEVTSNDSLDPANAGFIVNQLAATNINVTSATYIYLAFA